MKKLNFNFAIVLPPTGDFGGAQKRFSNLFKYIYQKHSTNCYYFISSHLNKQIKEFLPGFPFNNVKILDLGKVLKITLFKSKRIYKRDPITINKEYTILRKIYWFYNNYFRQYKIYKQIEKYRKELDIKVFFGVYSGILPLYFYLKQKNRKVAVIFSDMDSWFFEVHSDMKPLWYRKYYSFNYGLKNSDYVDFLSPYILKGIRERGIKIKDDAVSIAPCSFIDYSKCKIGKKKNFEIAFAGRLEPNKNPLLFLKAAKVLLSKYPFVRFYLLGTGSLADEIVNFICENNLTDKINTGFHPNPPEILAETSVFVSLQSTNNYPSQSILEAMACGNAIVATDVGDTRMFINEQNGLLIDLGLNDLVNAVEKLIMNRELTRKLGRNASGYAMANHIIEKCANYYLNLFEKASSKIFSVESET